MKNCPLNLNMKSEWSKVEQFSRYSIITVFVFLKNMMSLKCKYLEKHNMYHFFLMKDNEITTRDTPTGRLYKLVKK